jgi:hypothetical protein
VTEQDGPRPETVAEVAERLMAEFGHAVPLDAVTASVLSAQRDLDRLALEHAPPTLLDRLARARLADILAAQTAPPTPQP